MTSTQKLNQPVCTPKALTYKAFKVIRWLRRGLIWHSRDQLDHIERHDPVADLQMNDVEKTKVILALDNFTLVLCLRKSSVLDDFRRMQQILVFSKPKTKWSTNVLKKLSGIVNHTCACDIRLGKVFRAPAVTWIDLQIRCPRS